MIPPLESSPPPASSPPEPDAPTSSPARSTPSEPPSQLPRLTAEELAQARTLRRLYALEGMAMDQRAREGRDKLTGEPLPKGTQAPQEPTPMPSPGSPIGDWMPRLGGPDFHSLRAEIEAELANVEATRVDAELEPLRRSEADRLRGLLQIATDKGGFSSEEGSGTG